MEKSALYTIPGRGSYKIKQILGHVARDKAYCGLQLPQRYMKAQPPDQKLIILEGVALVWRAKHYWGALAPLRSKFASNAIGWLDYSAVNTFCRVP